MIPPWVIAAEEFRKQQELLLQSNQDLPSENKSEEELNNEDSNENEENEEDENGESTKERQDSFDSENKTDEGSTRTVRIMCLLARI